MTSLVLEYPREEAKTLVKAAFENTKGIKQYHDDGHRTIGKSGMGLSSYGEKVIVEIPENQTSNKETMLSVTAEKEVATNITANPEKYQSRFLQQLEQLRGQDINHVLDTLSQDVSRQTSKEVSSSDKLRDGSSSMGVVMVVMMVGSLLFMFMMMAAIMP